MFSEIVRGGGYLGRFLGHLDAPSVTDPCPRGYPRGSFRLHTRASSPPGSFALASSQELVEMKVAEELSS